jgi:hypothetical protein
MMSCVVICLVECHTIFFSQRECVQVKKNIPSKYPGCTALDIHLFALCIPLVTKSAYIYSPKGRKMVYGTVGTLTMVKSTLDQPEGRPVSFPARKVPRRTDEESRDTWAWMDAPECTITVQCEFGHL